MVWAGRPKLIYHIMNVSSLTIVSHNVQDFKYQMINKFSSIDNASSRQKTDKDLRSEIYLITSPNNVWNKWEEVFEAHEAGDLVDPDTGRKFKEAKKFKCMKPAVREFFRPIQGLTLREMEKAAFHMLHSGPTAKRPWPHPKVVFTKPKTFVPSCYQFADWAEAGKKKKIIVQELGKLVLDRKIFVDGQVHDENWRAFKQDYKFTSASMAALIREAGDEWLKLKMGKVGRNKPVPDRLSKVLANFIKEKMIVTFEGDAAFNPVVFDPLKIQGWPGTEARKAIRIKAGDKFPFSLIDFRNIPGGSIEGAMSSPFYEPFFSKFVDYASPRLREVDIWLWIVEDKKSEQVYELVRRLQPDYAVSKSHYRAAPAEGAHSSLKAKKGKDVNLLCLYFVYKAEFVKHPDHPLHQMEALFEVPDETGNSKSLYDEAKYAMYPSDELRMEFYIRILKSLTSRGDCIFNVFGGSKPMIAALVRNENI